MPDFRYFVIPYDNLPNNPTYTVWFATWTTERPKLEPGMEYPIVVGATADEKLPLGAIALASSSKDPVPPPPPPSETAFNTSSYQVAVTQWLELIRDEDEGPAVSRPANNR